MSWSGTAGTPSASAVRAVVGCADAWIYSVLHRHAAHCRLFAIVGLLLLPDAATTSSKPLLDVGSCSIMRVILIGSTGNVGTYLLSRLISSPQVDEIWCWNRADDASRRQIRLLADRGLPSDLPGHVSFLRADLTRADLGLPADTYHTIRSRATHIVHSAWPVDFNRSFASFEPSVRGVRHLVDFVADAAPTIRLCFLSSISAAGNWIAVPGARLQVPEEEIEDWKVARFGYGQSKLVSERLLAEASRTRHITAAVCRIGQIAGPVDDGLTGCWPPQEWLPSLIASSKHLNALPASLGPMDDVDWIPVDRVARIVTELLLQEQKTGSILFHHISNPTTTPWKRLLPAVIEGAQRTGQGSPPQTTDLSTWVDSLAESSARADGSIHENPAIKLLPFYKMLQDKAVHVPRARAAVLDTKHTKARSATLKNLEAVNEGWMALWMRQWSF